MSVYLLNGFGPLITMNNPLINLRSGPESVIIIESLLENSMVPATMNFLVVGMSTKGTEGQIRTHEAMTGP